MSGRHGRNEKSEDSLPCCCHIGSMLRQAEDPFIHMATTEGCSKIVKVQSVKRLTELRGRVVAQFDTHPSLIKEPACIGIRNCSGGKFCVTASARSNTA